METGLLCILVAVMAVMQQASANDENEKYLRNLQAGMSMPTDNEASDLGSDADAKAFGFGGWPWGHEDKDKVTITLIGAQPNQANINTYAKQKATCMARGERLCKLAELCPTRGYYEGPYLQTFVPGFNNGLRVNTDSWVAYETNDDTRGDNCNGLGGCYGNAWVQIGNWAGSATLPYTCNTLCEAAGECPTWGIDGSGYGPVVGPNALVCCEDSHHH